MKYFLCVCLLCLMTTRAKDTLVAQPSSPFFDNAWQYWGPEDGLPQSFVYTIVEDQYGRLWIGTQAGVSMFDGEDFHTWGALQGLSSGDVRALCIDASGNRMWIAMTGNALFTMDLNSFHIQKINFNHQINALLSYKNSVLVATNEGVYSSLEKSNTLARVGMFRGSEKKATCLAGDSNQWFAGYETAGLWGKTTVGQEAAQCLWLNEAKAGKESGNVNALCFRNNRVSAVCGNDLIQWKGGKSTVAPKVWGSEEIIALMEDNIGRLWIGTMGSGIFIYDPSKPDLPRPITTNQLSNKQVHVIFQDSKGVVWAGTKDGLYAFSDVRQSFFTPELYNDIKANVYALAKDPLYPHYLWVGTWEQGFQRLDLSNYPFLTATLVITDSILSNKDRRAPCMAVIGNEVWVGTAKGIFRIHNRGEENPWVAGIPDIGDHTINARAMFYSKGDNALWVIARKEPSDQLLRFPINKKGEPAEIPETFQPNIGGLRTLSEIPDDNALWLGTERGLFRVPFGIQPDADFFKQTQPLVSGYILSLHASKTDLDKLWIGRKSEGILVFSLNRGRVVKIWDTGNSEIPDNSVYSIAEDKFNRLWLGTNNGLVRFDIENNFFATFGKVDHLPHEYNINAFAQIGDTMWFGGVGGVAGFRPLEPNNNPPPVSLFMIKGENSGAVWLPIKTDTRHWFSSDNNQLKFVATYADYTDPSRSVLRFTLVQKTWLGLGKTDTVNIAYGHTYTLPLLLQTLGHYRLYVEPAEINSNIGSQKLFSFGFIMLPSTLQLLNVGLFIFALLLLYAWLLWIVKRNRQLKEILEIITEISARTRDAQSEGDLRKALKDAFVGHGNILKNKLGADVFAISMVNLEHTHLIDWLALEKDELLEGWGYSLDEIERPAIRCFLEKTTFFDNNYHRKARPQPISGEKMNSVIFAVIQDKEGKAIGVATLQAKRKYAFKKKEHIYFLEWLPEVLSIATVQQRVIEKAMMQVENDRLRFSVLSSQMNPHFLSNMFKVLANEKAEPERQRAFARRMAFVARSWLYATEEEKEGAISLKDDWEILTEYVNALKTRYNLEDLRWTQQVDLPPSMHTRDIKIPVLFIQPYVENSIEHGLSYRFDKIMGKGAVLGLRTFLENEYLCIELKDNGGGITKEVEAWLNTDNPIQQPEGKHKSKSVLINRERVRIINRLNPDFKSAEKCDAIKVNGPKNYFSADNPETPCGVVVTVCLRIDLVLKGYLGK